MAEINYELLRTFAVVARGQTLARAASDQRMSVSAISQRVRALESQLGFPVFEREGRRVRLNTAGQRLRALLEEHFAPLEGGLAALADSQTALRGRVSIGSPRTFGSHWLRPRLARILRAYQELQLTVSFDVPSVLERQLVDGLLDFAVLVRPAELSGVTTSPIALETFLAIGATRTRGGHPGPRTLADFQAQRWAVFDGDLAMHRTWWRAAFGPKAALPERVSCQVASLEELLALAESGAVLTVLPDYLVGPAVAAGRVTVLAPAPGQYARQRSAGNTIFLAWRTGAVESARVRAVREVLQSP